MGQTVRLSEAEEGFCQDVVAGLDLLLCFRRNYPNDKRKDNKARYQARMILKKPKIADRVQYLKSQQDFDGTITPETLKAKAWEWVHEYAGRPAGIAAFRLLCKDAGIGVDKLVIEDNTGIVELQRNLFARRMAMEKGEEVPPLLEEKEEEAKLLREEDYEIVDEDEEDDEEDDGEFEWDM